MGRSGVRLPPRAPRPFDGGRRGRRSRDRERPRVRRHRAHVPPPFPSSSSGCAALTRTRSALRRRSTRSCSTRPRATFPRRRRGASCQRTAPESRPSAALPQVVRIAVRPTTVGSHGDANNLPEPAALHRSTGSSKRLSRQRSRSRRSEGPRVLDDGISSARPRGTGDQSSRRRRGVLQEARQMLAPPRRPSRRRRRARQWPSTPCRRSRGRARLDRRNRRRGTSSVES